MVSLPLDDDEDPASPLTVNQDYARRFTHNKQREALHRLQELQKRGVVDSSDESSEDDDDDDDGVLPTRTQLQIFDTLAKIKNRDPSIYSEEARFFDDVDDQESGDFSGKGEEKRKKKPVYLKDVLASRLIQEGPDFQEEEERPKKKAIVTYGEEQQALKNEFLRSAEVPNSDDEELLQLRKKTTDAQNNQPQGDGLLAEGELRTKDADIARRLDEYFGRDENLGENEKFLKSYLLNKSWIDEDDGKIPSYEEIVGDIIEDEEELEDQEKFEAEYNFRFEEALGSQVMGHSRVVEGSVRRKGDTRRQKRENKKERLSNLASERREELKRLKNIKKRDLLEKLEKIRGVAGAKTSDSGLLGSLQEEDLEEEFDPEEYDRKMKEVFGEGYYEAQDADDNFEGHNLDLEEEMPDEDELLSLHQDLNEAGKAGFAAARERAKELYITETGVDASVEDVNSEDSADNVATRSRSLSKRKKKGKISLREKLAFDKQLEEYYKLDYEDMIGDLPTRFKYRQVKANSYGLAASEILRADDKDLNQYVSLKKLAPYVTQEWKPKWRYQVSQTLRKKRALRQQISKQVTTQPDGETASLKDHVAKNQSAGGPKSKRKRRKKGLSLSESRLIAYGKISLPSKKRKRASASL